MEKLWIKTEKGRAALVSLGPSGQLESAVLYVQVDVGGTLRVHGSTLAPANVFHWLAGKD